MTGLGGVAAIQGRVAEIESRLGPAATGRDVRAQLSFEQVLASVTTLAGPGSSAGSVAGATPTGALERLSSARGVGATGTAGGTLAGVPYAELFQQAGARHGLDPALLAAVAGVESGYDPAAVSHAGAQGLMQLMPGTAAGLGVTDSFDPAQAVDGAARLLAGHLRRFGSTELALAAYNAGPGAVSRFGGIPPYPETQAYVPKVLHRYEELR